MVVGLGTGSTAAHVVEGSGHAGGRRPPGGRHPDLRAYRRASSPTRHPTATFAEHRRIDLTIDGADEVQLGSLDLIKGLGGALLREKIVAAASDRLVVVVDHEKLVDRLGEHTPVPVEVTQFGWQATATALAKRSAVLPERRYTPTSEQPYVTDGGNFILDCRFGPITSAQEIERADQPDCRGGRERPVCRPQLRRRRRVGRRRSRS